MKKSTQMLTCEEQQQRGAERVATAFAKLRREFADAWRQRARGTSDQLEKEFYLQCAREWESA